LEKRKFISGICGKLFYPAEKTAKVEWRAGFRRENNPHFGAETNTSNPENNPFRQLDLKGSISPPRVRPPRREPQKD
jgi:hypothetical protein